MNQGAATVNFETESPIEIVKALTGGRSLRSFRPARARLDQDQAAACGLIMIFPRTMLP